MVASCTTCDSQCWARLVAARACLPQDLALQLPDIGAALNAISLPTIPGINLDLDSIKQPVANTADELQGVLQDGAW